MLSPPVCHSHGAADPIVLGCRPVIVRTANVGVPVGPPWPIQVPSRRRLQCPSRPKWYASAAPLPLFRATVRHPGTTHGRSERAAGVQQHTVSPLTVLRRRNGITSGARYRVRCIVLPRRADGSEVGRWLPPRLFGTRYEVTTQRPASRSAASALVRFRPPSPGHITRRGSWDDALRAPSRPPSAVHQCPSGERGRSATVVTGGARLARVSWSQ
jgi:hypothetical protein